MLMRALASRYSTMRVAGSRTELIIANKSHIIYAKRSYLINLLLSISLMCAMPIGVYAVIKTGNLISSSVIQSQTVAIALSFGFFS